MSNKFPVRINILVQRDSWGESVGNSGRRADRLHKAGTLRGGWRMLKKSLEGSE